MSDLDVLKTLIPVNSLAPDNFRKLAAKTRILSLPAGEVLFRQGDQDGDTLYLLSGEIALMSGSDDSDELVVVAGSDKARYALAQLKPRQYTGTARTDVRVARMESAALDRLLTVDQATGYEVTEFDGGQDTEWMWRMLTNKAFNILPPENINAMFARLQPVEARAGQVVIRQGDPGDYYYIIKSGRATVARKSDAGKVGVLSELGEGEAFGEEALLAGAPRNATVIMKTDGVLMRLAKQDFDELLKAPVVRWVGHEEARAMVKAGAGLIDVRLEDEHRAGAIKGSVNIPLYLLRLKAAGLDPGRRYIVYCQTGSRGCVAAFLLSQRGFDVSALKGGLDAVPRAA
jgi:CRP-like cAMP-binding protein